MATTIELTRGPDAYENWRAMQSGTPSLQAWEFPLYSDAHVAGEITEGCGPYNFFNAVAMNYTPGRAVPILYARVSSHIEPNSPNMKQTDDSRYHGGSLSDELAALWSLILGIRLRAGGMSRWFRAGGDPMGNPYFNLSGDGTIPEIPPMPLRRARILPYAVGGDRAIRPELLNSYPLLSPGNAIALVKAARSYQTAMWIAESDPNLAWLMLVSALETVAVQWRTTDGTPVEVLRSIKPEWVGLLEQHGNELLLETMASNWIHLLGSTKRFIDFVLCFLPAPPLKRPQTQQDWSPRAMKQTLRKIYEYRSKALHGGTPFPQPMCDAPWFQPGMEAPAEMPIGLATSSQGGVWMKEDCPILLHVFEYITRGVLLKWWNSLAIDIQTSTNNPPVNT
jgi:hypothetical protein